MILKTFFKLSLLIFLATSSFSDEIRMAYLELQEYQKNSFNVVFKTPINKGKKVNLHVNLPSTCKNTTQTTKELVNSAYLNSWSVQCNDGLLEQTISIDGLKEWNTDLLLKIDFLNQTSYTALVPTDNNSYTVPAQESSYEVAQTYTFLGIEHILIGFDHLLFVFALLLIVTNFRQLILTITAFTLAHSITLAGSALGYMSLPSAPVEAIIALSIIFLAMEVIHKKRGSSGLASRLPWIVSFVFGLLHGFGFAGALAEIGLPEHAVPLALLFFNVGVEIGQLIFVGVIILIGLALKKVTSKSVQDKSQTLMVYAIGSLASFWFIERVSGF
ncbi:HupE/UreJ family protein [Sulfurimonas sp.]|nr:HupE/UreJ family protein [Sulfurimonas sp.]